MNADFGDAYSRHLEDAEKLFHDSRWANADHLYGLAAECGLKRLMTIFGMSVDPKGAPSKREDRLHATKVWDRYGAYLSGERAIGYALPSANPFLDWDVAQRYAHRSEFDHERVETHRHGAFLVSKLLKKAEEEGLL